VHGIGNTLDERGLGADHHKADVVLAGKACHVDGRALVDIGLLGDL